LRSKKVALADLVSMGTSPTTVLTNRFIETVALGRPSL